MDIKTSEHGGPELPALWGFKGTGRLIRGPGIIWGHWSTLHPPRGPQGAAVALLEQEATRGKGRAATLPARSPGSWLGGWAQRSSPTGQSECSPDRHLEHLTRRSRELGPVEGHRAHSVSRTPGQDTSQRGQTRFWVKWRLTFCLDSLLCTHEGRRGCGVSSLPKQDPENNTLQHRVMAPRCAYRRAGGHDIQTVRNT